MSLPWRYSSPQAYVSDTLAQLKKQQKDDDDNSKTCLTHLKIGKFFLSRDDRGRNINNNTNNEGMNDTTNLNGGLKNSHMIDLLTTARENPNINELSFCGVSLEATIATALVGLLGSNIVKKTMNNSNCVSIENNIQQDAKQQLIQQQRVWKRINLTSCGGMGVMALAMPPTHAIKIISIDKCNLTSHDFWSLGMILKFSTTLTTLDIAEETIDQSHATSLAEGIKGNKYLQSLQLSHCIFPRGDSSGTSTSTTRTTTTNGNDNSTESTNTDDNNGSEQNHGQGCTTKASGASKALAYGLKHNQYLRSLSLPGCELEDEDIAELVYSVTNHTSLTKLKLFRNHCSLKGITALENLMMISSAANDQEIVRKETGQVLRITEKTKSSDFIQEQQQQQQQQKLKIHETNTVRMLQARLSLYKLDLSYQHAERNSKLDITLLASSLAGNTTVTILSLAFNKLINDDAIALSHGIARNSTLQELDLRANNIQDDGIKALAKQLRGTTKLRKLYLFGNPFGEIGAAALLETIRDYTELVILNLDYKSCCYDEIQYYACLNYAGRRLLKDDQNFSCNLWPLVLARSKQACRVSRGICTAPDIIYHFLRGRPILFH